MARSARPSDVHPATPPPAPGRPPTAARPARRWLAWAGAGLLAAALAAAVWSAVQATAPGDVQTEDEAVAALRLYLEQELAREAVGAADAEDRAAVAARHAERVAAALAEARLHTGADVAARAYWGSGRHDELVTALRAFDGDVARLDPPAVVYLRVYVQRLPADMHTALRGHPVARPALGRLDVTS